MRAEELWSGLATLGWVASLVGGHTPGSELESVRYGPTADDRFISDTYTVANINITYQDEHGEEYTETSESGKYGEGFIGSSKGMAVHVRAKDADGAHDHTGCKWPLWSVTTNESLPKEPWVAVIRRGSCNFEIKVQNAWQANASAVLIYNDRDTTMLEKMKLSTDNGRNISAVFTYKWKGEEITRLIDNGTKVMIGIIKGRTFAHVTNNINKTSVLFVSISFIVLMVISLAWLVFYYIQRFRYIHAKDRLSKRLCCAAKKALSKIPVKSLKTEDRNYDSGPTQPKYENVCDSTNIPTPFHRHYCLAADYQEVQGDGECCAICIEPYKVSETLRSLPCRHDFHKNCIDPWLLEHRTCPMCKMDILKYYGFVFTGSQESILQLEVEEARSRTISPARNRHPLTLLTSDNSYSEAGSARSSRASSPDELAPSLARDNPCSRADRSCSGTPSSPRTEPRADNASVSSTSTQE